MEPLDTLPEGWRVWNAEADGRVVLVYRPDVFDGDAFPPACLPTLTVAPGASPDARPDPRGRSGRWHVALYLEPDVRVSAVESAFEDRDEAVERAVAVAGTFVEGGIDYRAAYPDSPGAYLDRLDELLEGDG